MVERIEVVKGPASSMYGSNAMGGAINIITRKPEERLSGRIWLGYGTYNTFTGRINLGQTYGNVAEKGFYYLLNGFYRQRDGYITQSEFDRTADPYIVASNLQGVSGQPQGGLQYTKGGVYRG